MEYIAHRINKISELQELSNEFGAEIDLRPYGTDIVVEHEPFKVGDLFAEYCKYYNHQTLILNVKSEGIEQQILACLAKYHIKKFFFLDCSFPAVIKLTRQSISQIALRLSEYEGIDTLVNLSGRIEWVWIDSFAKFALDRSTYSHLKAMNYKICLVSPELQGREHDIPEFADIIKANRFELDAICTKNYNIAKWRNLLK